MLENAEPESGQPVFPGNVTSGTTGAKPFEVLSELSVFVMGWMISGIGLYFIAMAVRWHVSEHAGLGYVVSLMLFGASLILAGRGASGRFLWSTPLALSGFLALDAIYHSPIVPKPAADPVLWWLGIIMTVCVAWFCVSVISVKRWFDDLDSEIGPQLKQVMVQIQRTVDGTVLNAEVTLMARVAWRLWTAAVVIFIMTDALGGKSPLPFRF